MLYRFNSNVHQRDSRAALFGNYEARTSSQSPAVGSRPGSGYGYQTNGGAAGPSNGAFSAYPGGAAAGFRSATPNSRGQYSDATLAAMESQTDEQMEGMMGKVKMLKDVRAAHGSEH